MGWYDYGARFYDPALGRFFAADPLAEKTFDWSPYRYGFCNPFRFTDPNGKSEISTIGGSGLVNDDDDDDDDVKFVTLYGGKGNREYGFAANGASDDDDDEGDDGDEGDEGDTTSSAEDLKTLHIEPNEPGYIGGTVFVPGVGNLGLGLRVLRGATLSACVLALWDKIGVLNFENWTDLSGIKDTNHGNWDELTTSRGTPEPWPIDPQNNYNNKGGKAILFEYYLMELINNWKDTTSPDTLVSPTYNGEELSPYDPSKYEKN